MKRGISYTKSFAIASATATLASCAVLWMHASINARILEQRRSALEIDSRVSAQIAAKSEFNGERLKDLRAKVNNIRIHLGAEGTWERITREIEKTWIIEGGLIDERGGYSIQYRNLKLRRPLVADWPNVVQTVKDLEALPGVSVAELEIRTSGGRDGRSMDLVRIQLALQKRRTITKLASAK
jgi:hypothetical protein